MDSDMDDRLLALIDQLQEALPKSGGRIVVKDCPEEVVIKGDREGFLRLGIGLVRGALVPTTTVYGVQALDLQAYDLFESNPAPVVFERVTGWSDESKLESRKQQVSDAACLLVASAITFSLGFLILLGVWQVVQWFKA